MTAMLVLIILSVLLGGAGLAVFLWSLRSGQYDDLEGASYRILDEDDDRPALDPHQGSSRR